MIGLVCSQRIATLVAACCGLCAIGACTPRGSGTAHPVAALTSGAQRILAPSFIWPGSGWDGIASSYPTVGIALLNIDSGPGAGPESNFQAQVATEEAAGVQMYGYVSVDYGEESLTDVEAEISDYASFYGVDNIFVDEASTDCSLVSTYYQPLYTYIHANGGDEILNPGTATSACYMSATDILDTFEGSYADYTSYSPPSWTAGYPADQFFNEIYDAPTEADMTSVVSQSQAQNVGWIYVTDQELPNPYAALPSYWSNEVATVAGEGVATSGPTITQFTPTSGVAGTSVTIIGTNLSSTLSVAFDGVPASVGNATSTEVIAKVPPNATSGPISVMTSPGTAMSSERFKVTSAAITSFTPASGSPGTEIIIRGANLAHAASVRLGGTTVVIKKNSATRIIAIVPRGANTGVISVKTRRAGSTTSIASFEVT